jgi:hypothetical protein
MPPKVPRYRLRVNFNGLCAFVPRGENEWRTERIDVLLAKAPPPEYEDEDEYANPAKLHLAVLKFDLKNLRGDHGLMGKADGFWRLENEDVRFLTVRPDGSDPLPLRGKVRMKLWGRIPGSSKPQGDPPDKDQESDITWLPEMSKVLPEAANVSKRWLSDDPTPRVVSRVFLEKGLMVTGEVASYLSKVVVGQFVPARSTEKPYMQAVAHSVSMETRVRADRYVLVWARNYSTSRERTLILRPIADVLELQVSNFCCGYALTERGLGVGIPQADEDFENLYQLCEHYDEVEEQFELPIPVPVEFPVEKEGDSSGGADPLRCTGVRFNVVPL